MASKNQFDDTAPAGGSDPSDLDPFAELTRIMGFDPRQPVQPKAGPKVESETSFLESLDSVETRMPVPVPEAATVQIARQVQAVQAPVEPVDDFGIDLERELLGDVPADAESVEAQSPVQIVAAAVHDDDFDAAFPQDVEELEAALAEENREPVFDADVEKLTAAFADMEADTVAPVQPDVGDSIASQLAGVATYQQTAKPEDIVLDDFDFGDIEAAISREMDQALQASVAKEPAPMPAHDDFDRALADALEDDFNELKVAAPAAVTTASHGLANVDMDFDAGLDWSELDRPKVASRQPMAASAAPASIRSAFDRETEDLIAVLDAAAAKPAIVSPGLAGEGPAASNPEPVSALAKMADPYQTQNSHDEWRQPARTAQPRAVAPEVQTTEMFDQAYSMVDDLDLPDVAYDEPRASTSEIDLEFDNLLSEMSRGDAPPARPQTASVQPHFEPRAPIASRVDRNADDYGFNSMFAQSEVDDQSEPQHLGTFDFDQYEVDEEPQPQPPYRGSARGNGGRGMMIAAIAGGIAVLGGLGAVAMSWSNGSLGAPAMVRADAGPVKVRPENPGGTTVPGGDSTVYDAVSRAGGTKQPTQERLVSATEEPMVLPQPNDEEGDDVAAVAKGEDRVEPGQADEVAQDPVAVAPRKVRTVIVKPDGSLAPAPEQPAAQATSTKPAQAELADDEVASIADQAPEQITTGATTPDPVKPAPVAAASGWSVQIASQPNEEGANKSLRDISKRYSNMIGDRGSNIIKAEVAGKGTFWRVRIAAASRDDAIDLCSNLKSAGGNCFVTR